jgi:hypothetical protein
VALSHLTRRREVALDKLAQTGLKMVHSAERAYDMRLGFYPTGLISAGAINQVLGLDLSEGQWTFRVDTTAMPFEAVATRVGATRTWKIREGDEEPCCCNCISAGVPCAVCP